MLPLFKAFFFVKWMATAGYFFAQPWVDGRQATGYQKKKLFESTWLGIDCYVLRYHVGADIPPHTDPVEGKRHYRANLTLKRAKRGGTFGGGQRILDWGRLIVFRPDLDPPHWVSTVLEGSRYILSVGWVRNIK